MKDLKNILPHKLRMSLALVALLSLLSFGFIAARSDYFEVSKNLDIFATLYKEINTYYVDDLDPNDLMKKGIDGMLASLDPYTNYYPESTIENFRLETSGKYAGLGSTIMPYGDYNVVSDVYKDLPADKAGLKIGDVVTTVAGKDMKGKSTDEVSAAMRGQPGTSVEMKVQRPMADGSKKEITFSIERSDIQIKNVDYSGMVADDIAYVNLNQFSENASDNVREAFVKLKSENKVSGLVLDLRGNPGGLLNEAVALVNLFVNKNQKVVETKGRVDEWNKSYYTLNDALDTETPVVVLIDRGSASASEIVSGALQDLDRAVVLGERSFGKGLVQVVRKLVYNTQLKVTTSKYYIPSGRCIQAIKNYEDLDESGKPKHIPDSLRTAFKTKNGRTVLDGAGIEPDVKMPDEELSIITQNLLSRYVIFDFATQYVLQHASIAAVKDFTLDEKDWNEFTAFVKTKNFDYETQSEKQLKQLQKKAEEEKVAAAASAEFLALEKKIHHNVESDLIANRRQIENELMKEIVLRYYYRQGQLEASLKNDAQLKRAIEILNKPSDYGFMLQP